MSHHIAPSPVDSVDHSESSVLNLPSERLDDETLLAAVRASAPRQPPSLISALRRYLDWFLPPSLLRAGLDARRRARFIVLWALAMVPFYLVLTQQLWSAGLQTQAFVAAGFGIAVLVCPVLIRLMGSYVVAGTLLCLLNTFVVFVQAFADAGLSDPILYWSALIPLAAALSVGPRLSFVSAAVNILGIGLLYALTVRGHSFPQVTPQPLLNLAAFLSVSTASAFAFLWGWLYEGQTLRALRTLNTRLGKLREALSHSEARYRSLFERVPLGVFRTTPDNGVLVVNPALVRILGCTTAEEAKAIPPQDVYADAEQRVLFRELIEREGEVQQFAAVWRRKDGRRVHVRLNARCAFDAEGRPLYYEGTVEDVTAQRRVQQALRKSEERFRSLVQNASDVTLVIDIRGALTYLSPSVMRVLGYGPETLIGRDPFSFVHPDDRRALRTLYRRALRSDDAERPGGGLGTAEYRVRHAEGHYVYLESVAANRLDDAAVGGIVLNARDVTERKRAEAVLIHAKEQAEEMARLKSAFLANMSHEIRTPLTGILGFAGILAEEVRDPEQQEFVALIEKSGQRLMETLNSVLDLARIEAGRLDLNMDPLPLASPVKDAVRLMQPLAQERDLELCANITAPDAKACVDASALHRILVNLVGNAIKFTNEGSVVVEVDTDGPHAVIRVRDTGVGIGKEFIKHLFEQFEQESTGIDRSHEGTGLGLSITRELVERMGGTIEVDSTKGVGSTFSVRFLSVMGDAPVVEIAPAETPERGQPRVLVVDDNVNTLYLIERMLRADFSVAAVSSARECLDAARASVLEGRPFDVVLLDINLGGGQSGEDVMHRLRSLDSFERTPIVAFTAYALPGDRDRFINAGFDDYLPKPFTKEQLLGVLGGMTSGDTERAETASDGVEANETADGAAAAADPQLHYLVKPNAGDGSEAPLPPPFSPLANAGS